VPDRLAPLPGGGASRGLPDLGSPRRIHVIGAGGSGMSAIARVLVAMGHQVSGSDASPGPMLSSLAGEGVVVHVGHDPAWVDGAEIVVRSTAVPDDDPEVLASRARGLAVWRRADLLAAICAARRTIAISGTHGKTTTSAMLAVTLRALGWHPSFIVGSDVIGIGPGAAWDPDGEWFVVEADESDGTFVELGAESVIVTSVEPDHLEFYGGFEALRAAFERFVADAPGPAVVCADDAGARDLVKTRTPARPVITYGTAADAGVRITDVSLQRRSAAFVLQPPDASPVEVNLAVPGLHNVRNAAAAAAMAAALGATWTDAARAVGDYRGVSRRFEARGEAGGVSFVDGYDHLPTEVASAIATAQSGGWSRVVVVFQPHRYSRTEALWPDFADSFTGADVTVVTGIYPAGESPRRGVSGRLIYDAVIRAHPEADLHYVADLEEAARLVPRLLRPGDVCLTLGAGDITRLPDQLRSALAAPAHRGESALEDAVARAAEILAPFGSRVEPDGSIGPLTTYRVGGAAALRVTVTNLEDLRLLAEAVTASGLDVLVVGRGSNLLVSDRGFAGLAVVLDADGFGHVQIEGDLVRAGAAVALPALARQTVEAGLTGLEWAVGVPGSVGGAVRMNAGGHGSDVASTLRSARIFDLLQPGGGPREVSTPELDYAYRHSAVGPADVVIEAEFALRPGDPEEGRRTIREIVRWRREHQPGGQNAGSVFTNPPGDSAGRVIDAAGLKGLRFGSATVSEKHANFIQADSGGSADDVYELMLRVKATVAEKMGIELRPEVRLVGFGEPR
jgi:UDP-N-acetylmuramate--alanine ligase